MITLVNATANRIPLPDESVHCVATSPPYWGLRDYGLGNAGIGLEPTIELYVSHLVDVFREVRRVLHPSGTCWLNIGDSYSAQPGQRKTTDKAGPKQVSNAASIGTPSRSADNLKPKDLCMIPARVALALQADGWWVRSEIIWHKPNAMPESVTDRPTAAHEYVFLLAKRARYYYDAEAIREPFETTDEHRASALWVQGWATDGVHNPVEHAIPKSHRGSKFTTGKTKKDNSGEGPRIDNPAGRNRRTVWIIPTQPYKGSHFATFPPALVEPMIKAGSSERGVCPECGRPWERVVEKPDMSQRPTRSDGAKYPTNGTEYSDDGGGTLKSAGQQYQEWRNANPDITTGWQPTCVCGAPDGLRPDDLEIIATPTGERIGEDPTLNTGRAGYNRPRGDDEGQRPITRYEQRHYAHQLKNSPYRAEMTTEALSAFEHYIRTDKSGARPVPQGLLETWIERGWIERVIVPEWQPPEPIPATVLDPFCGSGTTLQVARQLGRRGIGLDLSYEYLHDQARERLGLNDWDAWHFDKLSMEDEGGNGKEGEPLEELPLFEGLR